MFLGRLDRLAPVGGSGDSVALLGQVIGDQGGDVGLVVHDQYAMGHEAGIPSVELAGRLTRVRLRAKANPRSSRIPSSWQRASRMAESNSS